MPFRKDWGNEPTRRSGRLSEPKESSSRKRKNSEVDESEPKAKMLLTISMDGREIDSHCWICHKQGQEQICSSCPRVFHNQCLKSTSNEFRTQQNVCPECLTDSVDGTPLPTNITKEDLQDALSFIMRKVLDLSPKHFHTVSSMTVEEKSSDKLKLLPDLSHWPSAHKVCTRMDVSMLVDRINKSLYTTTAEFYRDVKWIYHNCYKEFGAYANETVSAKKIVKRIKNELLDMEACYECYHKNYSVKSVDDNPFVTLCEKPHRLLWVKLKGYPYWPSKCLKVINGLAHVHFFGTHDRTIVKANTCFLMSETNPSGKKILRSTYQKSEDEMKSYIKNYEKRHGAYQYAPAKLVFIPSDDECHVVNKRQETSFSLNVSMSSEVENENSNIEDSGDNDSQFIEIIDDVEIAEGSENNALYENCDIIDVPDEDEPEIAMNNSENGNFENQEESSGPCESTLQGVETSTALPQDGVAMYQKGFASPRYVLHMPSQGMSLQNTSTVFEPSAIGINVNLIPTTEYSSVENVQSSNISQGEIHTDLHSVSNTEPSNGPHCAENEEDLEVCYLAERPRTGMYTCTRTDLNTLCHPLVKSLVQEGEEFMQDVTKHFMQNLGHFGHVPKLVHKFLTAIVELDSVRQAKQDHLKQLKKKIFTPPNFSKFMEDVFKECDKQLQIEIALERNRSILTKSELFEVMLSNREKHFDLRNANQGANDASKRFVDQEAMTDGECELSPFTEEHFEVNSKERNQQMKKKLEKGALHAKSYTWCKKCFQLATIHCCTQAEYCGEKCREADLACHASVCEKPRNL